MSGNTVFVLHRKSANEEYVKTAVKTVRKEGHKFRVLVPFNKKEKPRVVLEAVPPAVVTCSLRPVDRRLARSLAHPPPAPLC